LKQYNFEPNNNLGIILQEQGRLEEAEKSYKQAISLKPGNAEVNNNLSITQYIYEEILPYNGMVTTIPASRNHSVVYNGKKDRVMIGSNFYSL
jgi:tetratricopeptide (TPR) repeat protein|tara:strand:+ start:718 stop:996 length:279 start_codon:yes stop_codon:yes gene_type:complete